MVTPELREVFAQRGVQVIPVEVGTRMFVDELTAADQAPQIVIGSPLSAIAREPDSELHAFRIRRRLMLEANPFLQDHVIGGHAVLPTVCAIAWIANACEQLYPGYRFFSSEGYKALKGIVFDETLASEYVLDLKEIAKTDAGEIVFHARVLKKKLKKERRVIITVPVQNYSDKSLLCPSMPRLEAQAQPKEEVKPFLEHRFIRMGPGFMDPVFRGEESVWISAPKVDYALRFARDRNKITGSISSTSLQSLCGRCSIPKHEP